MKMDNRSQRHNININRQRPRHEHKPTKYNIYIYISRADGSYKDCRGNI